MNIASEHLTLFTSITQFPIQLPVSSLREDLESIKGEL